MNFHLNRLIFLLPAIIPSLFLSACSKVEPADLVLTNAVVYTVDEANPHAEAVAIGDGLILFAGSENEVKKWIGKDTEVRDLNGQAVLPGFIEGHAHFIELGASEMNLDLSKTQNYPEVIDLVTKAAEKAVPGEWILGRGWHQEKWDRETTLVNGFPVHDSLSLVSPDNPVVLSHASGHAILVNKKAMELSGIAAMDPEIDPMEKEEHGEIVRDDLGNPTGILTENAKQLITKHIPEESEDFLNRAIEKANQACLRNGITSVHDAGKSGRIIELYKQTIDDHRLDIRLYVMLDGSDPELLEQWFTDGPLINYADQGLTVRSVKMYMDGALGSRGAWLLQPYSDRTEHSGHPLMDPETLYQRAIKCLDNGFQLCTHAIGDRANREVLNAYQKALAAHPEHSGDHRFRIEHAQHISAADIPRFAELGVIPAMQAIHMSSDRPWAIERLGIKRIEEGAYVWQKLLESGAVIVNGTDAPVEPVNPIACFYASVTRKTLNGQPEGGYEPSQRMTREQALRSYTLDAAYAAFEEDVKGSIQPGKLADIVVLDRDIMKVPESGILKTRVRMTILNGEVVFEQVSMD